MGSFTNWTRTNEASLQWKTCSWENKPKVELYSSTLL